MAMVEEAVEHSGDARVVAKQFSPSSIAPLELSLGLATMFAEYASIPTCRSACPFNVVN
jgi:hypothetical protein